MKKTLIKVKLKGNLETSIRGLESLLSKLKSTGQKNVDLLTKIEIEEKSIILRSDK